MEQNIATYKLAARGAADESDLLKFLKDNIGTPVGLSFADVERLDALRLQTLISAHTQWTKDNVPFKVCDISKDCMANLALLGVTPKQFDMDTAI